MPVETMPTVVGDISLGWISQALSSRFPATSFIAAKIIEVIPGTSTKVCLQLEAKTPAGVEGPPQTVIVKGGFEPHCADLAPLYRNEARFYRDVQPTMALRAPEAFFVHVDEEAHHSVVIMEDLRARGVRFLHPQEPQDRLSVTRRLAALARLHARSWNSPLFAVGEIWEKVHSRFGGWSDIYAQRYFEPSVWQSYALSPRGAAVSTRLHDGRWLEQALQKLGRHQAGQPMCLINGDTHLGNLYVDVDGEPGFFDPQIAKAPWHLEVSYHIGGALDVVDRRSWEMDLLAGYLQALVQEGGPKIRFEEAWREYQLSLIYGFFIFIINETTFQAEAINTAYTARFGAAVIDHNVIAMIDAL